MMTTLKLEIESSEVQKIKAVLKALGAKKIEIESNDNDKTHSELLNRIEEARQEKTRGALITLDLNNLWESI